MSDDKHNQRLDWYQFTINKFQVSVWEDGSMDIGNTDAYYDSGLEITADELSQIVTKTNNYLSARKKYLEAI